MQGAGNVERRLFEIGAALHERLTELAESARASGLVDLAGEIEQAKLDIANMITAVVLLVQTDRLLPNGNADE